MKKIAIIFASILISSVVTAQTDFAGTWKLNSAKSKLGEQFSMAPTQIIITQSANALNVEKHSNMMDQAMITKDKFTLDGKECINTGFQDSQKKSTLTWSEDKKSIKCISKISIGDGEMVITEIYKKDGNSLVIESSSASSFGDMAETQVYDKQ